ncbi:MAG TPA: MFS transporter [Aromatoleum sp.]|uniref:spinster family MFS transporter n=1 Tax=Aromatoleum sp. TaxID=2307007 RepID=UPI002B4A963A|nr:MFS transporter [Aromatoleum sp.]HJV26463.1 MFS transporter [Aromatoleum sp.]
MNEVSGRWLVLGLLFAVSTFNYIDRTIISILQVPIKRDLGLSDTQLGLLTGLSFALFYTTLSLPIARLADRTVRKRLVAAALAVWSGMTALTGLAANFTHLVLLRVGVAAGEAGSIPASHSMIADLFPPRSRATAMAILGLSLPVGMMFGFLSAGMLAETLGWRKSFGVIGVVGLLLVPIVLLVIREPARGRFDQAADVADSQPGFVEALKTLWHLRSYRFLIAGAALHAYVSYSVMNWSAPFYTRVHDMSIGDVSVYLALVNGIGGGIGMYLGGWLSDRLGQRDARLRLRVLTFGGLIFVPMALAQYLVESTSLSLAFGVVAFTLLPFYYGPVVAVPQLLVAPNMRALTSAVTLLVTNLVGLGLGPTVTGFISETLIVRFGMGQYSLRYAISAAILFSLVAAFMYWRASGSLVAEMRYAREESARERASSGASICEPRSPAALALANKP